MVFGIVCLVLFGLVAYFHWVQGLFSGAISMACAIVAATLAVGLNEWISVDLLNRALGDSTSGAVMCLTFAAVYLVARIVFDMFIPGNVRVPLYVDKIGGLLCGLVAGLFGVGTVAIAAQAMPVGPSIFGYSRYEIEEERQSTITSRDTGRQTDALVSGVVHVDRDSAAAPDEANEKSLMLGLDEKVAGFVGYQSTSGAFASATSLDRVHPNLLRELFFNRLGIQVGAKQTVGKSDFTLGGLWAPATLLQADGEPLNVRRRELPAKVEADPKTGKAILIVRVEAGKGTNEKDNRLRISTGNVRLVAGGRDYYPLGTMFYPGNILLAQRLDDYLIGDNKPIDFVFEVPVGSDGVLTDAKGELAVAPDAFIEVKRFGRIDLAGQTVASGTPTNGQDGIVRKSALGGEITSRISKGGKLPELRPANVPPPINGAP